MAGQTRPSCCLATVLTTEPSSCLAGFVSSVSVANKWLNMFTRWKLCLPADAQILVALWCSGLHICLTCKISPAWSWEKTQTQHQGHTALWQLVPSTDKWEGCVGECIWHKICRSICWGDRLFSFHFIWFWFVSDLLHASLLVLNVPQRALLSVNTLLGCLVIYCYYSAVELFKLFKI